VETSPHEDVTGQPRRIFPLENVPANSIQVRGQARQ
jgi:hypothetical protein